MENQPNQFEAKPGPGSTQTQKIANKGELMFPEKHPANPLKDEVTCMMSHRGGLASARTELY